jgi:hypothetical protein
MEIPKAFISYSHDNLDHKKWVLELAMRLRNNGIDAILDQFELKPGDDVPHFMETNLAKADKVLMICTENYVSKANHGHGGVGYEKMIITSTLLQKIDENKIIPVIRQSGTTEVPTFLKSKLYINFSKSDDFEYSYDELVRTIHGSPLFPKPPIGNNPFEGVKKQLIEEDQKSINEVLKWAAEKYNSNRIAYHDEKMSIHDLVKDLKITHIYAEIIIQKVVDSGHLEWFMQNRLFRITEKGKRFAYESGLI